MSRPVAVRSRSTPALAPDVWLLAVSLAAGLGTARLTKAPGAAHVVGPIVATVLAGHLGSSVARRLRVSVPVVLGAGVVAVALATTWGQLLSATRDGIPTTSTWRALVSRFDTAGSVIRSHPTPVPATPEVVLCIATGAGLVAVLGRCIWSWQESRGAGALLALVPSFGLFCYTALLSSQVDRLPGVLSYVVCALGFVIVADRAGVWGPLRRRADAAVSAPRRLASGAMAMLPAVVGAALAVVVPLAANPALATLKVDALPFPQPAGSGQGLGLATSNAPGGVGSANAVSGGPGTGVRAIDLVDNLRAVLVNRTDDVMFDAQTPLPTYWQVAVLTDFNGTAWLPDPTTEAAAQSFSLSPQGNGVPGLPALPEPTATKTFRAQVTVADLESTLLPLPPTTVSVNTGADMVPGFGALEPVEAAPGLTYVAVARIPVSATKSAKRPRAADTAAPTTVGSGPSTTVDTSALAPYLKLPVEPAEVVALAHQIVAGAKGPAARAAALARWFDSGRYRYTLSPPAPTGNALESFLFTTRAGFCQQFAAAYGVLARIDGLPTRIAVGFTTGDTDGHNRYRVTGADAHVWPEVYLGPGTGWTSFEPTPASSGEVTGVGVNSGAKSGAQSSKNTRGRSTATTASTVLSQRRPPTPNATVPKPSQLTTHGRAPRPLGATRGSRHPLVTVGLVAAVVAILVALSLWVARRVRNGWDPIGAALQRWRRSRRRPASDPTEEVLDQWRDAVAVLERARLGRRPAETLQEHAARLSSLAGAKWLTPYRPVTVSSGTVSPGTVSSGTSPGAGSSGTEIDASVEAYARLAALAARASYGGDPCTPADAADAGHLGAVVRSGLARPSSRSAVRVPS